MVTSYFCKNDRFHDCCCTNTFGLSIFPAVLCKGIMIGAVKG